jgi:hypothetical protein
MEPLELGMAAAAAKWAWSNGGETVTKEAFEASLRFVKDRAPEAAKIQFVKLGDRLQAKWPGDKNPFDEPELLARMVEAEDLEPEVIEAIEAVTQNIPPIQIRNQEKSIIFQDNSINTFNSPINMNFD